MVRLEALKGATRGSRDGEGGDATTRGSVFVVCMRAVALRERTTACCHCTAASRDCCCARFGGWPCGGVGGGVQGAAREAFMLLPLELVLKCRALLECRRWHWSRRLVDESGDTGCSMHVGRGPTVAPLPPAPVPADGELAGARGDTGEAGWAILGEIRIGVMRRKLLADCTDAIIGTCGSVPDTVADDIKGIEVHFLAW